MSRVFGSGVFGSGAVLLAAVVSCAASCASTRPARFENGVYRDGAIAFALGPTPSGWRAIDVTSAALAYRDDAHAASILVNARCDHADSDTPLVALTNHLVIGSTERELVSQEVEPFDGREALHTRMRAKWDGVPMALEIVVLKKDGCVYDFVYTGSPDSFAAGSPAFSGFVRSFRTLPGSGVVPG